MDGSLRETDSSFGTVHDVMVPRHFQRFHCRVASQSLAARHFADAQSLSAIAFFQMLKLSGSPHHASDAVQYCLNPVPALLLVCGSCGLF